MKVMIAVLVFVAFHSNAIAVQVVQTPAAAKKCSLVSSDTKTVKSVAAFVDKKDVSKAQ